ncbi:MAG: Asp23/Gls24 family envelope stress response protein [Bacilli bacterium]|jgi:uncharacterized alkaline shock family protein YloU|nr:Asp23/Gls24 family envelope stress response protein [Bacilli bacterium]MCH4202131.1 Asp23/Gls24 family envelope stress response protein [Bacilli bacterium]MCH4235322.1 Asp23/Gls24 family envelope stress response protein [Bacilli bacterium]HMM00642.1 Asp23/Gls24 family envelope stress response protein [Bacilli bacterium]
MAQYVYIQNYTRNGLMGISHVVFDQIAEIATNNVAGAKVREPIKTVFSLHKPIQCSIRNGLVDVKIYVNIDRNVVNVSEVATRIQEEVANALTSMTELIPFKINVEISSIS